MLKLHEYLKEQNVGILLKQNKVESFEIYEINQ